MSLAGSNRESHVDTSKDIVGVGLAVEESLTFIVTLKLNKNIMNKSLNTLNRKIALKEAQKCKQFLHGRIKIINF
jgi:hypothetical protein